MLTSRKVLLRLTAVVVALFVVAFPLGDAHHGIGEHHHVVAVVGQAVFTAFLVGALCLIVLTVVALLRAGIRSARART
jgi:di/tricarboxylate transporter